MAQRIDSLRPGSTVTLNFKTWGGEYDERAIFVGIIGEGDERKARFLEIAPSASGEVKLQEWDAYRYKGRWVYGSSAQNLSLINVLMTI